jgi:D-3-phosphoglycerate dehydrogenase
VTRPTILIGESRFADSARRLLEPAGDVVEFARFHDRLPEADAIVVGLELRLDAGLLARAERLRVIATRTSQLRHLDREAAASRGIDVLFIEPDAPTLQATASTAEETIALLLALVRNLPWAFDALKEERWERARYGGSELRGKTLGLVGFGRLGRMVAHYAQAFGMTVLAHDPYVADAEIGEHGVEPLPLDEVLRRSEVLSLHCTWSDETFGLIGERELARLPPGALLVNTARGEITDEAALLAALESGALGGAAVDTLAGEAPDGAHLVGNPLVAYARAHENLIVLPHLGGATREATERTQQYICGKLVRWLQEHR